MTLSIDRMMLSGVTVVPATVWLAVCVAMVGASNLHPSRLTPDQYASLISHRHELHRGTEEDQPFSKFRNDSDEDQYIEDSAELQPKGQDPAKNQPVSISISSYWKDQGAADKADLSISSGKSSNASRFFDPLDFELLKQLEKHRRLENSAAEDLSPLLQDKQLLEYDGQQFLDQNINVQESSERARSPLHDSPPQSEDPFVADDTFQDQGPGSVEIYKLDLLRERLLPNPMPASKLPMNGKSKVPKKTTQSNEKTKTTEHKAVSPKMFHKQSNSFDDHSSDTPPNTDPFSIGGVPELQVGCEGLAASRQKRSINSLRTAREGDLWSEVNPISLDLDYDMSDEKYEEMDELFKLKQLETTTKGTKQNRGDIEATLFGEFQDDVKRADKLPVRGDLGESSATTVSATLTPMTVRNERKFEESRSHVKTKRSVQSEDKDVPSGERPANQMRKILWVKGADSEDERGSPHDQRWGFDEMEGVVASEELNTETQRRRKLYERFMAQQNLKKWPPTFPREAGESRTNVDTQRLMREYEKHEEERQKEERRTVSPDKRATRWQQEEEHRRRLQNEAEQNRREEEERRRLEEEERRRLEEERRRSEEGRRRSGEERRMPEALHMAHEWRLQTSSPRPRWEEVDARSRQIGEEARRWQNEEEARRRHIAEEARRRQNEEESRRRSNEEEFRRRQQEKYNAELEARRREWMLKKHQKEEEERRREALDRRQPPNASVSTNENRPREQWEQWEREQKLRDYIQRNQPVNVGTGDRRTQEANRRRLEEERKLQEYIRRNQPVQIPRNASNDWTTHRRKMEEAGWDDRSRYPSSGSGRRDHGPSATMNVEPRRYEDEARRRNTARKTEEDRIRERERLDEERLREEARRRELEIQRLQSRRYEEQRQRMEAERRAAQEHTGKTSTLENMGSPYGDRRRFEDHSKRQETSFVPANLVANEARRAAENARQIEEQRRRMEESRRRMENARRRPGGNRAKEARENQERARDEKEQWRRQEVARLNALPVIARILIRPEAHRPTQRIDSRTGFGDDIVFTGFNPHREGARVPNFPAAPTRRPPAKSPPPCVWAVVQCCPSKTNRLVTCFESMGCPGINWDPNPCRVSVTKAAREQVMKFYEENDEDQRF